MCSLCRDHSKQCRSIYIPRILNSSLDDLSVWSWHNYADTTRSLLSSFVFSKNKMTYLCFRGHSYEEKQCSNSPQTHIEDTMGGQCVDCTSLKLSNTVHCKEPVSSLLIQRLTPSYGWMPLPSSSKDYSMGYHLPKRRLKLKLQFLPNKDHLHTVIKWNNFSSQTIIKWAAHFCQFLRLK